MKNLLAIAAMLLLTTTVYAQTCDYEAPSAPPPFNPNALLKAGNCVSNNGYCHTPKGNLHIMFVYVVFNNEQPDANQSWWPVNDVPTFRLMIP